MLNSKHNVKLNNQVWKLTFTNTGLGIVLDLLWFLIEKKESIFV